VLWVDIVIIAVIVTCSVAGVVRGLIGEILSFCLWVLAVWISLGFNREFSILLSLSLVNPAVRVALSFVGLLTVTLVIGTIINNLLIDGVAKTGLGFFNRFWALLLGSLHGIFIVATIILLAGLSPLPSESWWDSALLIPPFQSLAIFMRDTIPSEMASYVHYH
jgi:membrane protein required for colicin V production